MKVTESISAWPAKPPPHRTVQQTALTGRLQLAFIRKA